MSRSFIVGAVVAFFVLSPVVVLAVTYANVATRFNVSEGLKVGKNTTMYAVFDKGTNATCYIVEGKTSGISCLASQLNVNTLSPGR